MTIDEAIKTLNEDYALRASLQRKKLKVQDELEDEIDDLEQSVITSKIIPELEAYAKKLLSDLQCEVLLAVKKDSRGDVEVCDELNYGNGTLLPQSVKQATTPQPVQPISAPIHITTANVNDSMKHDLRITVNSVVFEERNAIQTFIKALEFIGLDRVASVGIMCAGYNLVDTRERKDGGKRWQQQVDNKWVYVYFSNPTKCNYLFEIAEKLKLNIGIEAI